MPKLYVVSIRWVGLQKTKDDLKDVFEMIGDWLYFSNQSWLVWTDKETFAIYQILSPHLSQQDAEIIFEVLPGTRFGYAPKWVWDWIDQRSGSTTQPSQQLPYIRPQ